MTDKRAARREQILDCAQQVFAERGYHASGVSDILERASIARGTFYLHFDSKRAVFDILLANLMERVREAIHDVDLAHPERTVQQQLLDNVERVLSMLFEERSMARILLSEAVGVDADLDRKLVDFYDGMLSLISETLQLGQLAGIVRECDTWLLATCILGSVKELVYQHILRDRPSDIPAMASEILAYNLRGFLRSLATQAIAR